MRAFVHRSDRLPLGEFLDPPLQTTTQLMGSDVVHKLAMYCASDCNFVRYDVCYQYHGKMVALSSRNFHNRSCHYIRQVAAPCSRA